MRLAPLATLAPTISTRIGIVTTDPPPATVFTKPATIPPVNNNTTVPNDIARMLGAGERPMSRISTIRDNHPANQKGGRRRVGLPSIAAGGSKAVG